VPGLLSDLAAVLRNAGCVVVEYDGWQTRARSGGSARYADPGPWAVYWHHTASSTSPANDASYMCHGSGDKPVANLLGARDGAVWVLAAGPTNTNGKGGPHTLPDGRMIPLDSANSRVIGMEIANGGTGETYPAAQIDAAFRASNAMCAAYGVRADNVVTHTIWAPTRKIDPATAAAVDGPWQPQSTTSSGTWSLVDVRAECVARSTSTPPDPGDDDMLFLIEDPAGGWYVTDGISRRTPVPTVEVGYDGIDKGIWRGAGRAPIQLDVGGWQQFLDQLETTRS
jgi:hypothetical protein